MKKKELGALVNLYAVPVLLLVLGVILLLNPDSAAIVIAKIIGWTLSVSGVGYGIYAFLGDTERKTGRTVTAVVCLILGSVLLVNPLILARNIGRVLGIILAVEAVQIFWKGSGTKAMGVLTLVGAVVMIMAPMTASRLVFSLCGIVLVCIGAAQLLDKNRRRRLKKGTDKPDIIDAL